MDGDFYEDDEPIEKIRRDIAAGEHGVTRRPAVGVTRYLALKGLSMTPASDNRSAKDLVTP